MYVMKHSHIYIHLFLLQFSHNHQPNSMSSFFDKLLSLSSASYVHECGVPHSPFSAMFLGPWQMVGALLIEMSSLGLTSQTSPLSIWPALCLYTHHSPLLKGASLTQVRAVGAGPGMLQYLPAWKEVPSGTAVA